MYIDELKKIKTERLVVLKEKLLVEKEVLLKIEEAKDLVKKAVVQHSLASAILYKPQLVHKGFIDIITDTNIDDSEVFFLLYSILKSVSDNELCKEKFKLPYSVRLSPNKKFGVPAEEFLILTRDALAEYDLSIAISPNRDNLCRIEVCI